MSATDSDVPFDPDTVCDRVTQRVNELWQNAVINSIRHGPDLCDLQIPRRRILRGAWELRCALEDGISGIRTTSGLLGEHLDKRPFINSPGGDPNWKMANAVINTWKELFFEPQRDNVERLIAGLRMATRNAGSQDHAVRLLDQFKESTILPDYLAVRELVEKAIDLIQVTPLDVDNAQEGADDAPRKNTQRPGDEGGDSDKPAEQKPEGADESQSNEDRRAEWIGKALMLRKRNPNMTKAEISRRVGVHPGQLSPKRCPELASLEQMFQRESTRGYVTSDEDSRRIGVEAIVPPSGKTDRGDLITGSRLFREYCSKCDERIRVTQEQVGTNPCCTDCAK